MNYATQTSGNVVMSGNDLIVLDPAILAGKPIIRGTRISVEFIIGLLADGWTEADIIQEFPTVSHEGFSAALAYARDVIASERVFPAA